MASGDFVWLIGNDDLLLPFSLKKLKKLIENNSDAEFFFVNSFFMKLKFN